MDLPWCMLKVEDICECVMEWLAGCACQCISVYVLVCGEGSSCQLSCVSGEFTYVNSRPHSVAMWARHPQVTTTLCDCLSVYDWEDDDDGDDNSSILYVCNIF